MTFEIKNKKPKKKKPYKMNYVLNQFYTAMGTKSSSFIHVFMLGQVFNHSLMLCQLVKNVYNIHAQKKELILNLFYKFRFFAIFISCSSYMVAKLFLPKQQSPIIYHYRYELLILLNLHSEDNFVC